MADSPKQTPKGRKRHRHVSSSSKDQLHEVKGPPVPPRRALDENIELETLSPSSVASFSSSSSFFSSSSPSSFHSSTEFFQIRRRALLEGISERALHWPRLLDLPSPSSLAIIPDIPNEENSLHKHREFDQVEKDIERSMWRFVSGITDEERLQKRRQLASLVHYTLFKNSQLHYFQGFHELASVLMLVCGGPSEAYPLLELIAKHHLKECMQKSMEPVIQALNLLYPIIGNFNPALADFLQRSGCAPFFAVSWILTWFSHVVEDLDAVSRLFDAFLASHPLFPLYVSASVVLQRSDELLLSTECDASEVYALLNQFPQNLPWNESILPRALMLFHSHPPDALLQDSNNVGNSELAEGWLSFPFPYSSSMMSASASLPASGLLMLPEEDVNQLKASTASLLSGSTPITLESKSQPGGLRKRKGVKNETEVSPQEDETEEKMESRGRGKRIRRALKTAAMFAISLSISTLSVYILASLATNNNE